MRTFCECGCGKLVGLDRRFIQGHNSIIKPSEETKKKMSEAHKGRPTWNKGIPMLEEHKRKISKGNTGKIRSKEMRERYSEAKKGITKENNPNLICSKKTKRKMSETGLRHWQNPEYKEKQLKAIFAGFDSKPTKPERRLKNGLNKMFPGEYKFVGDGKIWIAGRNPDFININNQKKIIEMFGDYWHGRKHRLSIFNDNTSNEEHEEQRIKHFARYGFKTLIVWEYELKNIKQLKKKLVKFNVY